MNGFKNAREHNKCQDLSKKFLTKDRQAHSKQCSKKKRNKIFHFGMDYIEK